MSSLMYLMFMTPIIILSFMMGITGNGKYKFRKEHIPYIVKWIIVLLTIAYISFDVFMYFVNIMSNSQV